MPQFRIDTEKIRKGIELSEKHLKENGDTMKPELKQMLRESIDNRRELLQKLLRSDGFNCI